MTLCDSLTEYVKCPFCDQEQIVFFDLVGINTQRTDDGDVTIQVDITADPVTHHCLHFASLSGYLD